MSVLRFARPLGAIAALLVVVAVAFAQSAGVDTRSDAPSDPTTLQRIERVLAAVEVTDAELAEARVSLDERLADLVASRDALTAESEEVATSIEALGEPVAGEATDVARERERLSERRAELTVELNRAVEEIESTEAAVERVVERRRTIFSETLFRRQDLGAAFADRPVALFAGASAGLAALVGEWVETILVERPRALVTAAVVIALGALVAGWLTARMRHWLAPLARPSERPTYLSRVSRAFGLILWRTLGFLLFGAFTFGVLERFGLIDGVIESMVAALIVALVGLQLGWSVLRVTLGPARPAWRLFDVDDAAARSLYRLGALVVLVFVLDALFGRFISTMGASVSLLVIQNFVAAVLTGLLFLAIANVRPGRLADSLVAQGPAEAVESETGVPDRATIDAATPAVEGGADPESGDLLADAPRSLTSQGSPDRWPAIVRWPLVAVGVGLIVSALLGYIGLAQFVARQIVITGAILATMYIGAQAGRALSSGHALAGTAFGRLVADRRDVSDAGLDRLGVLLRLVIGAVVLVVGVPLILMQWGFSGNELAAWAGNTLQGFRVGSVTVSLGGVLLGLTVFVLGWFLVRLFTRWVDGAVLEKGRVDPGVRNSVRTIVGYVGLFLVALFALSIAGVSFASLAVVAGALSVGIGFGLQNIVSNFVSGLILLAERPFRVGDIVETGTTLGVIQKISVRSTTIETFTKQSVIVPNSDLINGVVSNWTLGNRETRADIPVGVSYGADPRRVHELLLEIAEAHPLTLSDPAPMVAFMGFGASSLDFELRFYLANVSDKIPTVNEVSYQIFERLAAEDIEIPFPQQDIHIRSGLTPSPANEDVPRTGDEARARAEAGQGEGDEPTRLAARG